MTFTARYPGRRCGVCDERINVGDEATFVDDEMCHATCPTPVALADPCARCFMVPAVNGECAGAGCE